MELVDSVFKSDGCEANVNGILSCSQPGEGACESARWGGAWDGDCEMGGLGEGNGKVVWIGAAEGSEPRDEQ